MYRRTVPGGVWRLWVWVVVFLCEVNAAAAEPRVAASGDSPDVAPTAAPSPVVPSEHWCAPELTPLTETVCHYTPQQEAGVQAHGSGTLVIFLHSLVSARPKAAWEQQLRMRRLANTYGFTILIPRGRPGFGPGRDPGTLAWPTAQQLQQEHEAELLAEWEDALRRARASHGAFERVFLVGFSNGAYYATSLAFRERFPSDGVAVFAGGSGNKYHRLTAARAKRRVPMFVGYGTLDPDNPQQRSLVSLLKQLGWPHRALGAKVGHTVSPEQLRAALQFLGHPSATKERTIPARPEK
jgi:predicted esterase